MSEELNPLYASTGTVADEPMTFDKLREALEAILADPLAEWMKSKGFDPAAGCKLVLPVCMEGELGAVPPNYASYSPLVEAPFMFSPNWKTNPEPRRWDYPHDLCVRREASIIKTDVV